MHSTCSSARLLRFKLLYLCIVSEIDPLSGAAFCLGRLFLVWTSSLWAEMVSEQGPKPVAHMVQTQHITVAIFTLDFCSGVFHRVRTMLCKDCVVIHACFHLRARAGISTNASWISHRSLNHFVQAVKYPATLPAMVIHIANVGS